MRDLEDYERRGDYLIPRDTLEEAQEAFERRSPRSQAVDRAMAGSVTTDFSAWRKARGRGLDFPGIDTPSDDPRLGVGSHVMPFERGRVFNQERGAPEDAILAERPDRQRKRTPGDYVRSGVEYASETTWGTSGRLANVLRPGSVEDTY